MPKASEVVSALRWRAEQLDRRLEVEDLSVEELPYTDIPDEHWEAVNKFRRFNTADRQRVIKRFNETLPKPPKSWQPRGGPHRVLVLGAPRSWKAKGPDGVERLVAELLIEADGELAVWRFGVGTFKQFHEIEREHGLDRVWVEVRRVQGPRFSRVMIVAAEGRD